MFQTTNQFVNILGVNASNNGQGLLLRGWHCEIHPLSAPILSQDAQAMACPFRKWSLLTARLISPSRKLEREQGGEMRGKKILAL